MIYEDVFRAFDREGIRYLVVGAMAMNLHGAPRMTADLDIIADLDSKHLSKLLGVLEALEYRSRLPVDPKELLKPERRLEWKRAKGLFAFTFVHPKIQYQEIDLLLEPSVPFFEADNDKKVVNVESIRIPVMSIDHLIAMKRSTGRQQDQSDIETLEQIKRIQSKGTGNG